jgi:hypothetical protein
MLTAFFYGYMPEMDMSRLTEHSSFCAGAKASLLAFILTPGVSACLVVAAQRGCNRASKRYCRLSPRLGIC